MIHQDEFPQSSEYFLSAPVGDVLKTTELVTIPTNCCSAAERHFDIFINLVGVSLCLNLPPCLG